MNETLVMNGGAVKSLGNGRIGGYLVLFSTHETPDLAGDYFDATTDFGLDHTTKSVILYDHCLDPTIKNRKLGVGEMKADDVGIWLEATLSTRDDYERAILELAQKGKLGWSSGTASHLVEREPVGKSQHITAWPLGLDASLTPTPCEPRTQAVPLKSVSPQSFKALLKEIEAQEGAEVAPPMKSTYLGDNIENSATVAAISRLNDALMYSVVSSALQGDDYYGYGASGKFSAMTPDERAAYLRSAFDEFRDLSLSIIDAIAKGTGDEGAGEAAKSIKQFYSDPQSDAPRAVQLLAGQEFESFLKTMGAVVEENSRRLSWYDNERTVKQGRPISAENLTAMQEIHDGMRSHLDSLKALIDKHAPSESGKATPADPETQKLALREMTRFTLGVAAHNGLLNFGTA